MWSVLQKCKQVCSCHTKPDPACTACRTVAKNYDCTSDNAQVQSLSLGTANVDSSDIKEVVNPTVDSSDTRRVATNLNELALSNMFEVLATNLDVSSVLGLLRLVLYN